MQFQLLKVETHSVQSLQNLPHLWYNQTQFRWVEVPSLRHHMVYQRLSDPLYKLERTISHLNLNLNLYKHWNKDKILRIFTVEYFK